MSLKNWIFFKLVLTFEFIQYVSAVYCRYQASNGDIEHLFCLQKCCDAAERYSKGSICCSHQKNHEIFIGAGMATLIVVTIFALCFLYICCKQKILRQSQQYNERHQNTRIRRSRRTTSTSNTAVIPTVSSQIEPVLPPPYDALPPPYTQLVKESDSKTEAEKYLSLGPPPAYSLHDSSLP
ncbi:hypothetical protein ACF0H5_017049 [Mactra antiquata]